MPISVNVMVSVIWFCLLFIQDDCQNASPVHKVLNARCTIC